MKFAIESTSYHKDHLLQEYPFLVDYGFETMEKIVTCRTPIRDEDGKRIYQIGTRTETIPHIHIHTLEQLVEFSNKVGEGNSIIIFPEHTVYDGEKGKYVGVGFPAIEIYDGYRE